jgi:hypothetical protein
VIVDVRRHRVLHSGGAWVTDATRFPPAEILQQRGEVVLGAAKQEVHMQKLLVLTAVILVAMSVGLAIEALTLAPLASKPAPPPVTISIEDIHRQADVKSLPVLEVREPF